MTDRQPLWTPNEQQIESCNMKRFMCFAGEKTGIEFEDYNQLWQWSVDDSTRFWSLLWDFCQVIGDKGERILLDGENIEQAQWFPDARLNFAQNLLRERSDQTAILFRAEDKQARELSFNQLYQQVSAVAAWLKQQGVKKGDRVAAYLPNMPETIVAMLAATSLGAVWTSTSPDFGADSVIDRFGQTQPVILFCVDGYYYNGKSVNVQSKVETIVESLPTVQKIVEIPLINATPFAKAITWNEILETTHNGIDYVPVEFNHPLYILYSSGTTGKPKCITHKTGGVLLQHLKEHQLHSDIRPGDKVFYFTTCGWMMWNWLASALASSATVVLYDGSPFYPDGEVLWDYVEDRGITLFGTSAKYIDALKKQDFHPKNNHDLTSLRTLCSTGSVLAPESFDYVYQSVGEDINLASISGGTDICSCFVLGNPMLPVYRGESQCRGLGLAVDVFDDDGNSLEFGKGELVCTNTFPVQPLNFWGDDSGEKYHNAYFAKFENVWHHGDYVQFTENGGIVIYGRSDATLNPGGVRIGTAEIYRQVEQLEEVYESIVVGQDWDNDVRVVLFVVLRSGCELDDELIARIKTTIRSKCSSRHVPAKVIQVDEIPRTKSGKIVELAVRDVIHRRPIKNIGSLANPKALENFQNLSALLE